MKSRLPKLQNGDYVITAYAEPASGPGWANSPIWVIVGNRNGHMRQECIQPDRHTTYMSMLYPFSERAHAGMLSEARYLMTGPRRGRK